jgi:hypothetical protein
MVSSEPVPVRMLVLNEDSTLLEAIIKDYVLDTRICDDIYLNGTICSISWTAQLPITTTHLKRTDIVVAMDHFEAVEADGSVRVSVGGQSTGGTDNASAEIIIYDNVPQHGNILLQQRIPMNGSRFAATVEYESPLLTLAVNATYDLAPEQINYKREREQLNMTVLFLYQDEGYFFAQGTTPGEATITNYS